MALIGILLGLAFHLGGRVWQGRLQPVDTFLVLGGSIQREIYAAEMATQYPEAHVLISRGSADPCIRIVFARAKAPVARVWLEKCAQSTFGNFYFSLPILKQWSVRHVRLVTSQSHLPRALWMAQILLGGHGIWVEPAIVPETGVPGNQEFGLKTALDVGRSLLWAGVSQFYKPHCSHLVHLQSITLESLLSQDFKCEHQSGIDAHDPSSWQ